MTDDELRKIYYPIAEAWKLIRAQGEQIRRMSAEEYLISKMGSDADGHNKRTAAGVPE